MILARGDKAKSESYISKATIGVAILAALLVLPVFLGGALDPLQPNIEPHGLIDWVVTVGGGFVLAISYLYIYLSATGK